MHLRKKLAQEKCQHFFVAGTFHLQFPYHPEENFLKIVTGAAVEVRGVGKTDLGKERIGFVACEVYPVYLRGILQKILIPLVLSGAVEDHVTGRSHQNFLIVLPIVKISLAGGNVEKLIISSAHWSGGTQICPVEHTIYTAAGDQQRGF